jgi:hypothetical protein
MPSWRISGARWYLRQPCWYMTADASAVAVADGICTEHQIVRAKGACAHVRAFLCSRGWGGVCVAATVVCGKSCRPWRCCGAQARLILQECMRLDATHAVVPRPATARRRWDTGMRL